MTMLIPKNIIVHCSATKDTASKSWDVIRRNHMSAPKNWIDIGYHYGIELIGNRYKMLHGRLPSVVGAHCRAGGRNHDSLGVMIVGNFDTECPSDTIYSNAGMLLAMVCYSFNIPVSNIWGHRDFDKNKTCPGKKWNMIVTRVATTNWLETFAE